MITLKEHYEKMFRKYWTNLILDATLGTGSMSVEQLKEYLFSLKGVTMVTVHISTPVKLLAKDRETKEPNPYIGVIANSVYNGGAGGDYELNVMNRELQAHSDDDNYEPTFRVEPLWNGKGERIAPLLAYHKIYGDYYLVLNNPKRLSVNYTMPDGTPVNKEQLDPYWPAKTEGSAKQSAVNIAVENQVYPKYPKLSNITKIKLNNLELNITH